MAKPTILTRASKGSALTWTEGDTNLTNLRDATVSIKAGTAGTSVISDLNGEITLVAGTNVTLSGNNSTKEITINATGGGITDLVQDTTPQLGGNLDVNTYSIVSTSNSNITITPNGTGRVVIDGQQFPKGSGSVTGTVTDVDAVRNPNTLTLSNPSGVNSNAIITFSGTGVSSIGLTAGTEYKIWANVGGGAFEIALASGGGAITLTDPGTITDVNYSVATSSATQGQVLTYNTGGSLSWTTPTTGINSVQQDFNPKLGGNLDTNSNQIYNTTGDSRVTISNIKYPNSNGTNGQVLTTDGTGNANWANAQGITDVVQDTTPQLGGNLDVNGKSIVTVSNGNIVLAPNGTGKTKVNNINYYESLYTLTYGATITPDVANGNVQTVTLTGNVTFSAFTNPIAGQSLTLIVKQDATGSRTLTSTMKFAGGTKTLSTAANSVDIISVYYDGTTYWASLGKDFK